MLRASAASTMARVLGPRHTCWARSRSRSISWATLKGPIVDGGQAQFAGDGQTPAAHRLLAILDDHFVDALLRGFAGLAEADFRACQRLKFQRDVLEDMAQVGAVAQALKEAAALADAAAVLDHAGQPAHQAIVQTRKISRGSIQVRPGRSRPPTRGSWPKCSALEVPIPCGIP